MTLQELYNELPRRPQAIEPTQREQFVRTLADVTGTSLAAAKRWVFGTRTPSASARKLLAEHFRRPEEELFPATAKDKDKDKEQ